MSKSSSGEKSYDDNTSLTLESPEILNKDIVDMILVSTSPLVEGDSSSQDLENNTSVEIIEEVSNAFKRKANKASISCEPENVLNLKKENVQMKRDFEKL